MRWLPLLLTSCCSLASSARQERPEKCFTRSEATAIIENTSKIVTPNGIERLEKVRIGVCLPKIRSGGEMTMYLISDHVSYGGFGIFQVESRLGEHALQLLENTQEKEQSTNSAGMRFIEESH